MFYDIIEHFLLHTEHVGCTLAAIPVCGVMKGKCWLMSIFSETEKKSYQMEQRSFNTKKRKDVIKDRIHEDPNTQVLETVSTLSQILSIHFLYHPQLAGSNSRWLLF